MSYSKFLKGQGFLILQLLIYVWYTIRRAAVLRIPWALITSTMRKVTRRTSSVWIIADYYVLERRGLSVGSSSGALQMLKLEGKHYCLTGDTMDECKQLQEVLLTKTRIYKEYLRTGLPWAVARPIQNAHEGVMLITQGYKLVKYKPLEKVVIEKWPLEEDDWKSRLMQAVPIALSALNLATLSGTATLVLVALDLLRYVWLPWFEMLSKGARKLIHLPFDFLPFSLRYLVFLPLSWVWADVMPSNPYTLRLEKRRDVSKVWVKHGFWTDLDEGVFEMEDEQVERFKRKPGDKFETRSKHFDCHWEVQGNEAGVVTMKCTFKKTAGGFGKVKFSMAEHDYDRIMTSLKSCMSCKMNFVKELKVGRGVGNTYVNVKCWDHIDLMNTVLEPFQVKVLKLKKSVTAYVE